MGRKISSLEACCSEHRKLGQNTDFELPQSARHSTRDRYNHVGHPLEKRAFRERPLLEGRVFNNETEMLLLKDAMIRILQNYESVRKQPRLVSSYAIAFSDARYLVQDTVYMIRVDAF